ncbi:MAG TPA: PQQ-dependent sugar dehydrogenase [Cyclobacteriaceae bacterium]|nr:PQQ-dependent sugar dehydrogenase [Cyclobacteriaceae bacterium]
MYNKKLKAAVIVVAAVAGLWATSCSNEAKENAGLPAIPATGIKLPEGFTATIFADSLGPARHIAVTPEGNIYVKLGAPKNGQGTVMLAPNGGQAEIKTGFGDFGGTGVYVKNGYLYTTSNTSIFRYKLNEKNEVIDPNAPETIVSGLLDRDQHESKSIVLDNDGNIYVNIGAFSNACQEKDRVKDGEPGSKGMTPCPILDSAGGIWRFKADVANQTYKDGTRYATGLRNVVGLDWNQELNQLFVMQHGRDKLGEYYPQYFDMKQSAVLPAECMYALKEGDNCGWPYMYYDQIEKKKKVMPEYGGDGKKEADSKYIDPIAAFPGHLAPNGLLFYTGTQFPEKYKNGAFIAFHGSWNRLPEPQAGFFVVFQPFVNGKPSGDFEVFADGFSGSPENTATGNALRRPCGLAQGPDGSIYVTDDKIGGVFKISYGGSNPGQATGAAQ